jgi:hypothetical protein
LIAERKERRGILRDDAELCEEKKNADSSRMEESRDEREKVNEMNV